MTTLAKTYNQVNENKQVTTNLSVFTRYNLFIKKLEFSHYSVIAMAILVGSCLGSITAMKIFENNAPMWHFVLGLGFTMANLVGCIAQAPTKWVVNLFAASVVVNILLLLLNI